MTVRLFKDPISWFFEKDGVCKKGFHIYCRVSQSSWADDFSVSRCRHADQSGISGGCLPRAESLVADTHSDRLTSSRSLNPFSSSFHSHSPEFPTSLHAIPRSEMLMSLYRLPLTSSLFLPKRPSYIYFQIPICPTRNLEGIWNMFPTRT